ncbi:MAG: mRNA capping enzyme [Faunusvirus sp.]|uniref:mRNA capping enzyme n=1 Tax=Faunusvirus sp. TaxID=2487766 RepID=A0A3G4ZWC4_9VIRU|nr:MAG: mRNA capping enzyme [Faunusvirus sp.]
MKQQSVKHNYKLITEDTLDISYRPAKDTFSVYRISIKGLDTINRTMNLLFNRKNHVIFSLLANKIKTDHPDDIKIIKKSRDVDKTFNVDEYDLRVRVSSESPLTDDELNSLLQLNETERFNIGFRYKQRVSLFTIDDDTGILRTDATLVKMSNSISGVMDKTEIYELEIDYNKLKGNNKHLDQILREIHELKKVLQHSEHVIDNNEINAVLTEYKKLVYGDKALNATVISLYLMQPVSLEIQHVDLLLQSYTSTDKADGDRQFLMIFFDKVYVVSTNLEVRYTGVKLAENSKYNGTVLDGEYIYIEHLYEKFAYLAFDILFYQGQDTRRILLLRERLDKCDDVMQNCLHVDHKYGAYTGDFNLTKILDFHKQEIIGYLKNLNHNLKHSKNSTVFTRKYFAFPLGGHSCEVFAYAELLWNLYTKSPDISCPYVLDGLMFTGYSQIITNAPKEIKFPTRKWKPSNKNSIDFYIRFEKDYNTGQVLNLYDNSDPTLPKGKVYRICNLSVGRSMNGTERPILFKSDENLHFCHLYVDEELGDIIDSEGNIIQDNTVVEFYRDDTIELEDKYRWIPIRTRLDKTEVVRKYKKKWGNNEFIAASVYRSMRYPISIADINKLADPKLFDLQIATIRSKIDKSLITEERKQSKYYQETKNMAKPQRNFHNWVKSQVIYTYCSPHNGKKMQVLDIACGRGGDIMKYFHSKVELMVGIDKDLAGLTTGTDGALSRLATQKKMYPKFPKMFFINADGQSLLDLENQSKAIGTMAVTNSAMITEYFGSDPHGSIPLKFDRVNCHFAVHYMLENITTWNNFCNNIDKYLAKDGYLIITTFDGDAVYQTLKNTDKLSVHYNTNKGEKRLFTELVKKYDEGVIDKAIKNGDPLVSVAIDVYSAIFMEEGVYYPEYLVFKDFFIKELHDKCGLDIVDTDMFGNMFEDNRSFLFNAAQSESDIKTRGWFQSVKEFYDMENEENKASYEITKLNRYYVFRKATDINPVTVVYHEHKSSYNLPQFDRRDKADKGKFDKRDKGKFDKERPKFDKNRPKFDKRDKPDKHKHSKKGGSVSHNESSESTSSASATSIIDNTDHKNIINKFAGDILSDFDNDDNTSITSIVTHDTDHRDKINKYAGDMTATENESVRSASSVSVAIPDSDYKRKINKYAGKLNTRRKNTRESESSADSSEMNTTFEI